ncbi:MAG: hypothetical protein COA36_12895 [Desulfotalea sp.]|nr:MAG: hypothetical protein COA36_12895 [Desulfotalea sp.]
MKHIVTCLLLASFGAMGMVAVAAKSDGVSSQDYGEPLSNLIMLQQSMFSGLVFEGEHGLSITTNRGTFLLKGEGVNLLVGKKIRVKGVIRGESLLAVQVAVKS